MIYLSSFKLSECWVSNPNIYPYNVFKGKYIEPFVFAPITVFYGCRTGKRPPMQGRSEQFKKGFTRKRDLVQHITRKHCWQRRCRQS